MRKRVQPRSIRTIRKAFTELWVTIRLLKRASAAFTLASQSRDREALKRINDAKNRWGDLTRYQFGIELILLEIYLKACLDGISEGDYDWLGIRDEILLAMEYNEAEKLHLLIYLEELATTAGITLPIRGLLNAPVATQKVKRQLIDRFPKLSEAGVGVPPTYARIT